MSEKLQKVLAALGVGSRRDMEEYIRAGRVSVNGAIATIGDRVEGSEVIRVDGQVIRNANTKKTVCRVLMYNKPEGQMCTRSDPEGRPTVFDRLPKITQGRWLYVGRLDVNTSGLLLFTTDGELANALMHPSHEIERVYAVRVFGDVTPEHIKQLESGVELEDGTASFDRVIYQGGEGINQWYHVTLKEGRKREVRRLWEAVGLKVSRLKRIKYGCIELGKLPQGGWEELPLSEVNALRQLAGLRPETQSYLSEEDNKLSVREKFVHNRQIRNNARKYTRTLQSNGRRNRDLDTQLSLENSFATNENFGGEKSFKRKFSFGKRDFNDSRDDKRFGDHARNSRFGDYQRPSVDDHENSHFAKNAHHEFNATRGKRFEDKRGNHFADRNERSRSDSFFEAKDSRFARNTNRAQRRHDDAFEQDFNQRTSRSNHFHDRNAKNSRSNEFHAQRSDKFAGRGKSFRDVKRSNRQERGRFTRDDKC